MTETISIILFITSLVVFVLTAAGALLYVVVKIIMTGAFDNDDSLSDVDRNKDENSDND